ncbi:MAG TPA: PP2C family serine/threonine-protein phosphatase [Polyangiaceae bacterium]|nr:PP2C family serine/threonine-protein phosphatase [Polyangiaceae bacterium]
MRRCPACHALYPEDDRFCEVDGEVLVADAHKMSGPPTLPLAAPPSDVRFVEDGEGDMLLSIGTRLSAEQVRDIVEQTLEIGRSFERDGLAWQPQPEDFIAMPGNRMALSQARGVFHRTGPFDARPSLRALGEALLDAPIGACETGLVRLLSDPTLPSMTPAEVAEFLRGAPAIEAVRVDGGAWLAHPGYRRAVQQDAVAVKTGDGWFVLALCDGVSGSIDGGLAARVGSARACAYVAGLAATGRPADQIVREGVMAAHEAVCAAAKEVYPHAVARSPDAPPSSRERVPIAADTSGEHRPPTGSTEPPGATLVLILVKKGALTVGWAGDSRAYLVADAPQLLTRDHSWANAMLATGHVTEEEAHSAPLAYALTRCIGPLDDASLEPDVRAFPLPRGARLVVCSDGLWSYFARPDAMAAAVRRGGSEPAAIARSLVHEALMRGGHDNLSVVVYGSGD